jgi:membrane-associated phospholipid phosphatase
MPALPHHRRIAIITATASVFALLAVSVAGDGWVVHADRDIALWLRTHSSQPLVDASRVLTYLGSTLVLAPLAVVAAAVAWRARRRDDCLLLLRAVAGAELLFWSLKAIVQRPRPVLPDPIATATSFSFPSGHVTMATAVWGALALVIARRAPDRRIGVAAFAVASLLVVTVAFTRMYLGVHFLSDVVAGVLLGAGWLAVVLTWDDRTTWWRPAAACADVADEESGRVRALRPPYAVRRRSGTPGV